MKLNEQKELVLTQKEYDEILTLALLDCDCNEIVCTQCPFADKDRTCLIFRLCDIANRAKREE